MSSATARASRPLEQVRDRDDAAAGAGVEDAAGVRAPREGLLDEDLGLGPRDERPAVDAEGPPVEVPLADQVLDGHAR